MLHTEGLTKRYGRRMALTDRQLSVPRGRIIGLVGPNGAGKSTLLQLACGLVTPSWDAGLANRRTTQVGLALGQKAGRLSGGQRAQLALTVAAAKRPELLFLDEPAAALDPLARNGFLQNLTEFVAELGA